MQLLYLVAVWTPRLLDEVVQPAAGQASPHAPLYSVAKADAEQAKKLHRVDHKGSTRLALKIAGA